MAPSRILILGGGAAGWLSAAYLARSLPDAAITLVESPAIATVGVGEGSFPYIDSTGEPMNGNKRILVEGIALRGHWWHPAGNR